MSFDCISFSVEAYKYVDAVWLIMKRIMLQLQKALEVRSPRSDLIGGSIPSKFLPILYFSFNFQKPSYQYHVIYTAKS